MALTGCFLVPEPDPEDGTRLAPHRVAAAPLHAAAALTRPDEAVTIQTRVQEHRLTAERVRDLPATTGTQPRTVSMLMTTAWLDGALKGEGELAHSLVPGQITSMNGGDESRHRLLRMGLTGVQGAFRYGAAFRSAGDAVFGQRDQAVREVWGEWGRGIVTLRTTVSQQWNNVNRDPSRARLTGLEQRTAVSLAPRALPVLTLSYARGTSASSLEPAGTAASRNLTNTLEASVSMTRARWNARLFSSYALVSDRLGEADTRRLTHGLQASYRPSDRFTIAPSLSLKEDQQRWSGVQVETPSASLALTYAPRRTFNMTAFGLYSRAQSSDRLINNSTYKLKSVLTWTGFQAAGLTTTISLDAGYTASLDDVPSGHSSEDLSGLVRVQLLGL